MEFSSCKFVLLFIILQLIQLSFGLNSIIEKDEFLKTEPMKCEKDSECQDYAECKSGYCTYEIVCLDEKCYSKDETYTICKTEKDCFENADICEMRNNKCKPKQICIKVGVATDEKDVEEDCLVPECFKDEDCLSGKCSYNKCSYENSKLNISICGNDKEDRRCGLGEGAKCENNDDCYSENCDDNVCRDKSSVNVLKWVLIGLGIAAGVLILIGVIICICCCGLCCCC